VTRRKRTLGAALLLALVGVTALWLWRTAGARHPRVLLVGIDGADPAILDRLIAAGRLPTFARLRREGVSGPLRSREPLLSPLLWTTIATGRAPQDHGVLDFVEAAPDGHAVPITSARRRVPALWNIATQFGRSSGFIGWYASFPVERVRGFEVSDRIAFHQVASEQVTEGAAYPPALAASLPGFGSPPVDVAAVRRRFYLCREWCM
jgi:predicted AlkP superfamily phosphohydrolase/phosphomutase